MLLVSYPHCTVAFKVVTDSDKLKQYINLFYYKMSIFNFSKIYTIEYYLGLENKSLFRTLDFFKYDVSEEEAIYLSNKFIRENLELEDDWNIYHGSTIKIKDKNYLLLGQTGTGKTTLSAYLKLKKHAEIISEDISIINCKTKEVVTNRQPLMLRKHSYDILNSEYSCDISGGVIKFNGKYVLEYSYDTFNTEKNYLDVAILLNRNENKCTIDRIYSEKEYILNSFLHVDIVKNIRYSVLLYERLNLFEMTYMDLDEAYKLLLDVEM